ncbi:uncharacterized protein TRIVIDRAFT_216494 [Trichoderma virens Gv29-8]|uniref:Uncharacterized protein n=1 Tax=Hypocrea virens (strain Gv29-8 / FGSC 10586) TaxID=413071 RepID=G9N0X3_HYPVG|nr:uncharacterized protein TRIVIDRAFT_216494 [Trichoderma virens Gv29-8]EHK19406.1 hypothetical protein TRIVIDRAFT_216494 [Trichoderma virens Gv29-8]UKZ58335.1 hypothetical protein TrVGV298_012203 [Trichoderma virens]
MSKRKFSSDPPLPRKKAKVAQHHVSLEFEACDTLTIPSPPSSQTTPTRLEKRKRTDHSHIDSRDEPSAKRARTSQSPSDTTSCPRSFSPEPWPSIGYVPEEEKEPNPLVEEFYRSCIETEVACSCQPQTICRNPLPSPVPSESDASENEAIEQTIVHAAHQTRHSASEPQQMLYLKPQKSLSPKVSSSRRRNRSSRQRIERRIPVSSYQEQPRQQRRKKKNIYHDRPRDENPSPLVKRFLQSKRSSRRDSQCELWYLSNNGIACAVTSTRR